MSEKFYESQQSDEEVVLVIRRHIVSMLSVFSIAGLIYLIGFIAVFVLPFVIPVIVSGFAYNIYVLFVSLLFLFNTVFLFSAWVLNYLHVAILTTEHFVEIEQSGLFSRKISQMNLDKIQDVSTAQKGLINTIFNIGIIDVQTAGEAPNFTIEYVQDPDAVSHKIMETEENYSQRNGLRTPGSMPEEEPVTSEPLIEYPGE
jgi:uncharacterized membrane protein YdbT with pleckstrin-like domain